MSRLRRGATAVEFALLLPVLFAMGAGIATYAWFFLMQASLTDAVTEGARRSVSYVPPPDLGSPFPQDDDEDLPASGQPGIEALARSSTLAAARRAGWEPDQVDVQTSLADVDGFTMLTIRAQADVASRFSGWLFPLPATIAAEITLATLDQP